jgi:hypothetical protein
MNAYTLQLLQVDLQISTADVEEEPSVSDGIRKSTHLGVNMLRYIGTYSGIYSGSLLFEGLGSFLASYPPDLESEAAQLVLQQAEVLCDAWM